MVTALVAAGALAAPPVRAQQSEVGADVAARAAAQAPPVGRPLAKMDIRVRGRIPNAEKKSARIRIRVPGKQGFRGRIGIETRGQSSLRQFPKTPYAFEVRDKEGATAMPACWGCPRTTTGSCTRPTATRP